MIRDEVKELQRMGPFPSSGEVIRSKQVGLVEKYQQLIQAIEEPVTDDEARVLTGVFGVDDFFGLCWGLVHLIETAPFWPLEECLENSGNEWIEMLKDRAQRWRDDGYPVRPVYSRAGLADPRHNENLRGATGSVSEES